MTFKELLDCVRFEDVAPLIVKMYPDMGQSLGSVSYTHLTLPPILRV